MKVNEQVVLHKKTFENEFLNIDDTAPLNIEEISSRRAIEHKEIKGNEKVKEIEIEETEEGVIAKSSFDDIENILK